MGTTFSVSPRLTPRCPPFSVAFHPLSVTSQLWLPIWEVSRSVLPPPPRVPLILPQLPHLLTWAPQLCFPAQLPSSVSTHLSILWIPTPVFLTHVLLVKFTTTPPKTCKRPCRTTRTLQTLLPFLVWMSLMRRIS